MRRFDSSSSSFFLCSFLGRWSQILHEERPLVGQHLLEAGDLRELSLELGALLAAVDARVQRAPVPSAEEDADVARARERLPEAPHRGVSPLHAVGPIERVRLDVPRVHPLVERVESVPLARRLEAADDDDDGECLLAKDLGLRAQESFPEVMDLGVVCLCVDLVPQLCGFEHARPPG